MAENLCNEIKRLHKRKQLPITAAALERMQDSESSGSEMGPESPRRPDSPPNLMRHGEKALFTFKQVQLICESMIKERENQLRERYESVLTAKLAEQYDAFVKFTYDQIQRRYEAAPSCESFKHNFTSKTLLNISNSFFRPVVRLCEKLSSLTKQTLIIALRSYVTVDLPRQQQQPSFKLKKGKQNKKQQIRKLKTNQQKPKKKTNYNIRHCV